MTSGGQDWRLVQTCSLEDPSTGGDIWWLATAAHIVGKRAFLRSLFLENLHYFGGSTIFHGNGLCIRFKPEIYMLTHLKNKEVLVSLLSTLGRKFWLLTELHGRIYVNLIILPRVNPNILS